MKKAALICVLLGLAGCMSWEPMEKGLAALKGKRLDDAIDVLGFPSSERQIAGRKVFVWSTKSMGLLFNPATSTTYGNFGSTPYGQTTTLTSFTPVGYECEISIQVDDQNVIQTAQSYGNWGGCQVYMDRLKPLTQ